MFLHIHISLAWFITILLWCGWMGVEFVVAAVTARAAGGSMLSTSDVLGRLSVPHTLFRVSGKFETV